MEPPQIIKLNEDVINRIAAGEIIQRPANALKELIENSLDAKSTNIQITVKNGGLKMLQIQDNGTGIRKEDFEIVCERFTTSKLREFADLHKIATYGFRGEALASISHIAHLTITSKTKNDICAYQGSFVDGKLQGTPKPTAGNQGTIITVEDLFYNMSVRKKALRSAAEEYQKISDVVGKYAVHNAHVGFALKRSNESNDIRTNPNSNQVDNIRVIYGNGIARELIEFSMENEQFQFKVNGYISNVNYSPKKFQFLLFINHRLVDCQSLKRSIDHVYSTYLPKNTHPFVYLSLELDPTNIDVNVHPTKHEVHFLHEDQIVECIATALETKLLGSNNSRTFFTQSKLPKVLNIEVPDAKENNNSHTKTVNASSMVRTDAREQKLEKFFGDIQKKHENGSTAQKCGNSSFIETDNNALNESFLNRADNLETNINLNRSVVDPKVETEVKMAQDHPSSKTSKIEYVEEPQKTIVSNELNAFFINKITRYDTKLTSVLELRKEIEENCHRLLRETFAQHVFVGSVDPSQALIQYSTKMFLCNTKLVLEELFYQFIMYNFQNFDSYIFSNKISIFELARICLDLEETGWTPEDGDKSELSKRITHILSEKGPMLQDYFSMEIDEMGNICSIPILLDNYLPDPKALPMYVVRLATEVNWEIEKECFQNFARETARFYSNVPEEVNQNGKDWQWVTEHVLYPALKEYFIPPKIFAENGALLEIADLHNLYKVFERC
ncbi:DNA mismatch repair protein Mlh1 [Diorhabda carinulata]|uniref:DNA mismatch repair protein Mlh1 n=1 Tax=Diorhabda carinulata TaxID=1163345 RepID=UPI00259FED0F|nr:DNA mismatch repair protein Mlh1 [Diorhabda carinulata]XP_057659015.1 DNA mismatch repair protein Mlh1 [Diorhabda carinulata]